MKTKVYDVTKKRAPRVRDLGRYYVAVEADTKFEAFSTAIDYVAEHYPGVTFSVEYGLTGFYGGAIVTGSVCYFKAVDAAGAVAA